MELHGTNKPPTNPGVRFTKVFRTELGVCVCVSLNPYDGPLFVFSIMPLDRIDRVRNVFSSSALTVEMTS